MSMTINYKKNVPTNSELLIQKESKLPGRANRVVVALPSQHIYPPLILIIIKENNK